MLDVPNHPVKTRELHNHHFDSTIWNDFAFRDDDIVIATYAKSGTTWMQQIVGQLIFAGSRRAAGGRDVALARPARAAEGREAAAGRGADPPAVPQDAPAGRRARVLAEGQVHLHRPRRARRGVEHATTTTPTPTPLWYEALNDTPGRVGPPIAPPPASVVDVLPRLAGRATATRSGRSGRTSAPGGRSATCRTCCSCTSPTLKDDMPGEIRRIAAFLDIADRRGDVGGDPRALQLRLHEGECHRERAARRRVLGRRRRDLHHTRAPTAAGATC